MKTIYQKPRENNDSLELFKIMKEMETTEFGLIKLMNCSEVVYHWTNGYRLIPKSFRRFLLALLFIHRMGRTESFKRFVKYEERKRGW